MRAWIQQSKDVPGGWADIAEGSLPDLPVTVAVAHSALNYKDALALTGRSPIFRKFPMIPGIDMSGRVVSDASGRFAPGTEVVATGWGLGETSMGGYAEMARLDPDWALPLPAGLSLSDAAGIGTAGLTAALSVLALRDFGIEPDAGPVLVTGATGGVGGFAVALLHALGFEVVAVTGRPEQSSYLQELGAAEIFDRKNLEGEPRPLGKEMWAAAVDVAGGKVLANVLPSIRYGGAVAASGLASSMSLPTTVAPFILRNVALLGIDSVMAPRARRERAWTLLADKLPADALARMVTLNAFADVDDLAVRMLDQKLRGRAVLEWR